MQRAGFLKQNLRKYARHYIPTNENKYLITGAQGFLGAYILKKLLRESQHVVGIDLSTRPKILKQVLTKEELDRVNLTHINITELNHLQAFCNHYEPTHIIHLAGAQVPACKKNPSMGGLVNVVGTANVFQAVRDSIADKKVQSVVYASSAAICGPMDDYIGPDVHDEDNHVPRTAYGVYKLATEGLSRIMWQDHQIPSIGIRPYTIFGVGRELGVTSDVTKAIKSAVLGKIYKIGFKGRCVFNYCPDVAQIFIDAAHALPSNPGAYTANISHYSGTVEEFVSIIHELLPHSKTRISISNDAANLPFPTSFSQHTLDALLPSVPATPLRKAIEETIEHFEWLEDHDLLHTDDLPRGW